MGGFEQKKHQLLRLNQEIRKDTALSRWVCLWYSFWERKAQELRLNSFPEMLDLLQLCSIVRSDYICSLLWEYADILSLSLSLKPQVLIIQKYTGHLQSRQFGGTAKSTCPQIRPLLLATLPTHSLPTYFNLVNWCHYLLSHLGQNIPDLYLCCLD